MWWRLCSASQNSAITTGWRLIYFFLISTIITKYNERRGKKLEKIIIFEGTGLRLISNKNAQIANLFNNWHEFKHVIETLYTFPMVFCTVCRNFFQLFLEALNVIFYVQLHGIACVFLQQPKLSLFFIEIKKKKKSRKFAVY